MESEQRANVRGPVVRVTFVAEALHSGARTSLLDCSQFLVDLNLAYEICRVVSDRRYSGFHFSPISFSRAGRRVDQEDSLWVRSISFNSPLEVIGYVSAAVAVPASLWALLQIVDKVRAMRADGTLRRLNVKKAQLEIQKLEEELNAKSKPRLIVSDWPESPEEKRAITRAEERLQESPLTVTDVDIEYIRRLTV